MPAIDGYVLQFLCCCGMFAIGRFQYRRPETVARIFNRGQPLLYEWPIKFCRFVGLFFMIMSCLGVIFSTVGAIIYFI